MLESACRYMYLCVHVSICVQNTSVCQSAGRGINPLPDTPVLGSSNSAANKDMSKIWTNGDTVIWLSRKDCEKMRNCSLRAISPFPTIFSKAVCCWCVKMSIYGVKGWVTFSDSSSYLFSIGNIISSLPDNTLLASSKLKAFAGKIMNFS